MIAPPKVSIGMPTFRGARFLASAIDSVLRQSFGDWELDIVDDDSPDETAAIAGSYRDPRIRFARNPRRLGAEGNWNRCLELARGTYFKLLPQDDVLAPECLERQVEVLDRDEPKRIALTFCARTVIDSSDRRIMSRRYPGHARGIIPAATLVRRCIRYGTNLIGEPGGVMFRRELASAVGPFDASLPYVVDLDYWVRLLRRGDAYYLPEPLVSFRVSAGSWSVAIGAKQSTEFCRFVERTQASGAPAVRRLDAGVGKLMSRVNTSLRLIVYRQMRERG